VVTTSWNSLLLEPPSIKTASKKWLLSDTNPSSPETPTAGEKLNKTLSLVRKTTIFWSLNPVAGECPWTQSPADETRRDETRERREKREKRCPSESDYTPNVKRTSF
jgi:hypothetical protein